MPIPACSSAAGPSVDSCAAAAAPEAAAGALPGDDAVPEEETRPDADAAEKSDAAQMQQAIEIARRFKALLEAFPELEGKIAFRTAFSLPEGKTCEFHFALRLGGPILEFSIYPEKRDYRERLEISNKFFSKAIRIIDNLKKRYGRQLVTFFLH